MAGGTLLYQVNNTYEEQFWSLGSVLWIGCSRNIKVQIKERKGFDTLALSFRWERRSNLQEVTLINTALPWADLIKMKSGNNTIRGFFPDLLSLLGNILNFRCQCDKKKFLFLFKPSFPFKEWKLLDLLMGNGQQENL